MRIQILSISNNTLPGKKPGTSYSVLDIAYKNLTYNKTEGKKVMSFGESEGAFKVLKLAQAGQYYELDNNKIGDYYVWQNVTLADAADAPPTQAKTAGGTSPAPRSTYETPEERAARQRLIVRQSSVSSAIAILKTDKNIPAEGDVFHLAASIFDWVFETDDTKNIVEEDFKDDIPY